MTSSRPSVQVLPGALRAWRAEKSFTQESLAAAVDVTPGMIALIETGRRQPSYALLERIAEQLDIPADVFAFVEHPEPEGSAA